MRQARIPVLVAIVALGSVRAAAAQSQLVKPVVELGAEMTISSIDGGTSPVALVGTPRVVVNLSPRWALDFTLDQFEERHRFAVVHERTFLTQLRPALAESSHGVRFDAILGAGIELQRSEALPGSGLSSHTYGNLLFVAGVGVSRQVGRYATVRSEVKMLPVNGFGFGVRGTVGVTMPLGKLPPATRPVTFAAAPGEPMRIGQDIRVTTTGGETRGAILALTSTHITLARARATETIPVTSIRRLDVPQVTHVNRNRGMQIGGLAGLAAGLLTTISWVAGNGGEGSGAFLVWGPGLSVLGLAIGGTIGAEVDRTRMEWRTVFERRE